MAAAKKKRRLAAAHENEERWLLTYADMITLLMALFMVLFSISSVNVSKYVNLQQSLRAAFSGAILSGGRSILQFGSQSSAKHSVALTAVPSIEPLTPNVPQPVDQGQAGSTGQQVRAAQAASQEQSDLQALKFRLDQFAKAHGIASQVSTQITRQGLVVTILTDKLLFDSGSALLQPTGTPLLDEIGNLLEVDTMHHPILVEGFTDDVPIDTAQFPSNWELSTTRADTVLRYLLGRGIPAIRFGAAGYADLHPIASNATPAGRALNRRVDVVFERIDTNQS
jgi:chemotaxis protein MotB